MCIFAPEEYIANERSGSYEPLPGVKRMLCGQLLFEFEEFRGQEGSADRDGDAGEDDDVSTA